MGSPRSRASHSFPLRLNLGSIVPGRIIGAEPQPSTLPRLPNPMNEHILHVNDETFEAEVLKSGTPVLVDFWAEWCGPCRRLAPTVDALASEFDGRATVAKLNVDENPNVPGRYAVRGIPTLLLFKEGQLAETIVGLRAKEDIAQMIERHLGA